MRMFIVFLILFASQAVPASAERRQTCNGESTTVADDFRMICSATWQLNATCTGKDLWDQWKVTGSPPMADSFIRPWADNKITVVGYELVKLQSETGPYSRFRYINDRQSWFMVGSGIYPQPDAMLWLAPGQTHTQRIWPNSSGQIWPSRAHARKTTPLEDVLVVHGTCFGGTPVTLLLTIYYTPHD
jgi:hypothetical protein